MLTRYTLGTKLWIIYIFVHEKAADYQETSLSTRQISGTLRVSNCLA